MVLFGTESGDMGTVLAVFLGRKNRPHDSKNRHFASFLHYVFVVVYD